MVVDQNILNISLATNAILTLIKPNEKSKRGGTIATKNNMYDAILTLEINNGVI
jgi:hypothetical protein